jgi:hypothetical protein
MNIADPGSFNVTIQFDALHSVNIELEDVMECYFVEDIYCMYNLGKITLFDRHGIKEWGPLTGDEKIILSYGKTNLIEKDFSIYSVPKIEGTDSFSKTATNMIEMYFSNIYFRDILQKRFSKSWDISTVGTDIIKDIITNMLGIDLSSVEIEPSQTKFSEAFCIPQWNITNTIRWISERITGTIGKYGYLFFSNSRKYINYVTLDGLLKKPGTDPQTYLFDTTDMNYENKILSWQSSGVDIMSISEIGGGQYLGFNPATKSFLGLDDSVEFIYSDVIKKITSMGESSLFDGSSIDNKAKEYNYMYRSLGESNKDILSNMFYNDFIKKYSLHNTLKILVAGSDKRYAGGKIDIMWPSSSLKEIYNSMDSGMYLIKAITHVFTPRSNPMYTQIITLIKNAYTVSKTSTNTAVNGSGWSDLFNLGSIF